MENYNIFDLPFEDIIAIIESMKYGDIVRLCQTSKSFQNLCASETIQKILKDKLKKEVLARFIFNDVGGEIDLFWYTSVKDVKIENILHTTDYNKAKIKGFLEKLEHEDLIEDHWIGTDLFLAYYPDRSTEVVEIVTSGEPTSTNMQINKKVFKAILESYLNSVDPKGDIYIYSNFAVARNPYPWDF